MRHKNEVTSEDFVRTWVKVAKEGETRKELARLIGMTSNQISNRWRQLRRHGVLFPTMKDGRGVRYTPERIAALNQIIKGGQR